MRRFCLNAVAVFLLFALLGSALTGCKSTATPQLSAQEQKDFKGGPMPPEARAVMEQRAREARQGPGGGPGAPAPAPSGR